MEEKYSFEQFLNDTLFVLVLYEIPVEQSTAWQSLISENIQADVFIQDNSLRPQVITSDQLKINYVHDVSNPGVSKAYNRAGVYGQELKKKWLILMDQDTRFPRDWTRKYWKGRLENLTYKLFAPKLISAHIISPFKYWLTKGRRASDVQTGVLTLSSHFALNSGLMISLSLFRGCDGYDENFPLYFSDFAFLYRVKTLEAQMVVLDLEAYHDISFLKNESGEKKLSRFHSYCQGAKMMRKYTGNPMMIFLFSFGRALKLSLKYKSAGFISSFFRIWVTA
jgi:GT2 family glycosyltransferase